MAVGSVILCRRRQSRAGASRQRQCLLRQSFYSQHQKLKNGFIFILQKALIRVRSADVLSGRHFVRTALDVLSGRRFVRTSLDVLSGRRFVRTDLCDIFFRWTGLDVLSGRRFVRTVLRVVISWAYLEHISGISWAYLRHSLGISWAYLGLILGIS